MPEDQQSEQSPAFRIPASVKHEDFLTAVQPLLDLLGVQANEIYGDLHITGVHRDVTATSRISFTVIVPTAGEDREFPHGFLVDDRPQEFAELAHHVVVETL